MVFGEKRSLEYGDSFASGTITFYDEPLHFDLVACAFGFVDIPSKLRLIKTMHVLPYFLP